MNTRTENVWHDCRTDTMILTDPGHGKGPHKVDNAEDASAFWNAHKNNRDSLLRDPYNGCYWTTADARGEFVKHAAVAPVEKTAASPAVVVPAQPKSGYAQLWEPCDKCGVEPSYQTASGHLCANCGGIDDEASPLAMEYAAHYLATGETEFQAFSPGQSSEVVVVDGQRLRVSSRDHTIRVEVIPA